MGNRQTQVGDARFEVEGLFHDQARRQLQQLAVIAFCRATPWNNCSNRFRVCFDAGTLAIWDAPLVDRFERG